MFNVPFSYTCTPSACDKGIAWKERIAKTLGVQVSSKDEEPLLLPPRVSLEHAEASVRKTAMQQLVELLQQNNGDSLLSAWVLLLTL